MILKIFSLVLIFYCIIAFLSTHESFLPTFVRYGCWRRVGDVPSRIYLDGFSNFMIETMIFYNHQISEFGITFLKLGKKFQSQIWDPGVSNIEFEGDEIRLWNITNQFLLKLAVKIWFHSIPKTSPMPQVPHEAVHNESTIWNLLLRRDCINQIIEFDLGKNRRVKMLSKEMHIRERMSKPLGFTVQSAIWWFGYEMLLTHTVRIRRRPDRKKRQTSNKYNERTNSKPNPVRRSWIRKHWYLSVESKLHTKALGFRMLCETLKLSQERLAIHAICITRSSNTENEDNMFNLPLANKPFLGKHRQIHFSCCYRLQYMAHIYLCKNLFFGSL